MSEPYTIPTDPEHLGYDENYNVMMTPINYMVEPIVIETIYELSAEYDQYIGGGGSGGGDNESTFANILDEYLLDNSGIDIYYEDNVSTLCPEEYKFCDYLDYQENCESLGSKVTAVGLSCNSEPDYYPGLEYDYFFENNYTSPWTLIAKNTPGSNEPFDQNTCTINNCPTEKYNPQNSHFYSVVSEPHGIMGEENNYTYKLVYDLQFPPDLQDLETDYSELLFNQTYEPSDTSSYKPYTIWKQGNQMSNISDGIPISGEIIFQNVPGIVNNNNNNWGPSNEPDASHWSLWVLSEPTDNNDVLYNEPHTITSGPYYKDKITPIMCPSNEPGVSFGFVSLGCEPLPGYYGSVTLDQDNVPYYVNNILSCNTQDNCGVHSNNEPCIDIGNTGIYNYYRCNLEEPGYWINNSVVEPCSNQDNCDEHLDNGSCIAIDDTGFSNYYQCSVPNNGYWINNNSVVEPCSNQNNCNQHLDNEPCIDIDDSGISNYYRCSVPNNGYWINNSVVELCSNQVGCGQPLENEPCIEIDNTGIYNYYQCSLPNNGYWINNDGIVESCSNQVGCDQLLENEPCIEIDDLGFSNYYQCSLPNGGYWINNDGIVELCSNQVGCGDDNLDDQCLFDNELISPIVGPLNNNFCGIGHLSYEPFTYSTDPNNCNYWTMVNEHQEYLQIDLGESKNISGITTYGDYNPDDGEPRYVTKYKVKFSDTATSIEEVPFANISSFIDQPITLSEQFFEITRDPDPDAVYNPVDAYSEFEIFIPTNSGLNDIAESIYNFQQDPTRVINVYHTPSDPTYSDSYGVSLNYEYDSQQFGFPDIGDIYYTLNDLVNNEIIMDVLIMIINYIGMETADGNLDWATDPEMLLEWSNGTYQIDFDNNPFTGYSPDDPGNANTPAFKDSMNDCTDPCPSGFYSKPYLILELEEVYDVISITIEGENNDDGTINMVKKFRYFTYTEDQVAINDDGTEYLSWQGNIIENDSGHILTTQPLDNDGNPIIIQNVKKIRIIPETFIGIPKMKIRVTVQNKGDIFDILPLIPDPSTVNVYQTINLNIPDSEPEIIARYVSIYPIESVNYEERLRAGVQVQNNLGILGCSEADTGYSLNDDGIVTQCNPGTYSEQGASSCNPCEPGEYQPEPGQDSCYDCPAGTYSDQSASYCTPCAAGSVTLDAQGEPTSDGATSCTQCPAGQYSALSTTACAPCGAGTYSGAAGTTQCITCAPGSETLDAQDEPTSTGATQCSLCDQYEYSNSETNWQCEPCNNGFEATDDGGIYTSTGATQCNQCPPGQYSNSETTGCTTCPAGYETNTGNETGATICTPCPAGQYSSLSTTACTQCPAGQMPNPGQTGCLDIVCPTGSTGTAVYGDTGTGGGLSGCSTDAGYSGTITATTCSVNGSVCNSGVQWSEPNNYYNDGLQAVSCPSGSTGTVTLSNGSIVSAPIGTLKGGVEVNASLIIPNVVGTYLFHQNASEEDRWVFAHVGEDNVIRAVLVEESQRPNTNPTVTNGFYINNTNNTLYQTYVNTSTSPHTFKDNFDAGQMWLNDGVNATDSGEDFFIMEDVNWNIGGVPSGCTALPGYSGIVIATTDSPYYTSTLSPVPCPIGSSGMVSPPPIAYTTNGGVDPNYQPSVGVWDTIAPINDQGWIFAFKIISGAYPGWRLTKVSRYVSGQINSTDGIMTNQWNSNSDPPDLTNGNIAAGAFFVNNGNIAQQLDNAVALGGITPSNIVSAWYQSYGNGLGGSGNSHITNINWSPSEYSNTVGSLVTWFPNGISGCITDPGYSGIVTAITSDPFYISDLEQCQAGTFSDEGQSSCQPCGGGYETLDAQGNPTSNGATQCSVCPAGQYSTLSTTECAPCGDGTYSDEGQSSCESCPAGYVTLDAQGNPTSTGATQCSVCPAGQYSPVSTTACAPCDAGTFSDEGQSSCQTCANWTFSGEGEPSCNISSICTMDEDQSDMPMEWPSRESSTLIGAITEDGWWSMDDSNALQDAINSCYNNPVCKGVTLINNADTDTLGERYLTFSGTNVYTSSLPQINPWQGYVRKSWFKPEYLMGTDNNSQLVYASDHGGEYSGGPLLDVIHDAPVNWPSRESSTLVSFISEDGWWSTADPNALQDAINSCYNNPVCKGVTLINNAETDTLGERYLTFSGTNVYTSSLPGVNPWQGYVRKSWFKPEYLMGTDNNSQLVYASDHGGEYSGGPLLDVINQSQYQCGITSCNAGKYLDQEQGVCNECPAESYQPLVGQVGQSSCLSCPAGTYSYAGADSCNFTMLISDDSIVSAPIGTMYGNSAWALLGTSYYFENVVGTYLHCCGGLDRWVFAYLDVYNTPHKIIAVVVEESERNSVNPTVTNGWYLNENNYDYGNYVEIDEDGNHTFKDNFNAGVMWVTGHLDNPPWMTYGGGPNSFILTDVNWNYGVMR